jgi:hypothetical protein
MVVDLIWVGEEAKYFCDRGWTTPKAARAVICPSGTFWHCRDRCIRHVTIAALPVGLHERHSPRNLF